MKQVFSTIVNNVGYLISGIRGIFIAIILISLMLFINGSQHSYQIIYIALSILGIILLALISPQIGKIFPQPKRLSSKNLQSVWRFLPFPHPTLLVFVISFLISTAIGLSTQLDLSKSSWDATQIFQHAVYTIDPTNGEFLGKYYVNAQADLAYFNLYPNNIAVEIILVAWLGVWHLFGLSNFDTLAVLLNTLFVSIAVAMIYRLARVHSGKTGAALSLIFSFLLILCSPWMGTYYSDTVGLLFTTSSLFFADRLIRLPYRRADIVGFGLSVGIGAAVKPTVLVIIAATCLALFITRRIKVTDVLHFGVGAIIAIGSFIGIYYAGVETMHLEPKAMPATHFMMMGLKKTCPEKGTKYDCLYGAWNAGDVMYFNAHYTHNLAAYDKYTLNEIKSRLQTFGPVGYLKYASEKISWILSDGSFFAYREGSDYSIAPIRTHTWNEWIRSIVYHDGKYYKVFIFIQELIWVSVLIACIIGTIILSFRQTYWLALLLSVLGITFFVLFTEGRSRYVFLYLAPFILLGSGALSSLIHWNLQRAASRKRM